MAHLSTQQITERVSQLPPAPTNNGVVKTLLIRPETDTREVVASIRVVPGEGIVGDNYIARGNEKTPDGKAHPEAQICVMNANILDILADGDTEKSTLAGDQILVDFDLSTDNVPAGTRFSIGSATFEVANKPHNGCAKFAQRFGMDASRFANSDKVQRYRGINVMVVTKGEVSVGDQITKLEETGNGSFPPT